MSAEKTTVADVIRELERYPKDALVVGYGIAGMRRDERLDGVSVYEYLAGEGADGFFPIDHTSEAVFPNRVVVISPICKDSLKEWCNGD